MVTHKVQEMGVPRLVCSPQLIHPKCDGHSQASKLSQQPAAAAFTGGSINKDNVSSSATKPLCAQEAPSPWWFEQGLCCSSGKTAGGRRLGEVTGPVTGDRVVAVGTASDPAPCSAGPASGPRPRGTGADPERRFPAQGCRAPRSSACSLPRQRSSPFPLERDGSCVFPSKALHSAHPKSARLRALQSLKTYASPTPFLRKSD